MKGRDPNLTRPKAQSCMTKQNGAALPSDDGWADDSALKSVRRRVADRDAQPEPVRAWDDRVADDLLHQSAHAVILVDERGRVVRMNKRATEIVAQGDGLLIQHDVLRGVRPTDTAVLHRLIGEAVNSGPGNGCAAGVGLRLERPARRWPLTALVTPLISQESAPNGETSGCRFFELKGAHSGS